MELVITAPRSELAAAIESRRQVSPPRGRGRVLIDIASQSPNSLLHDGHAWKRHRPQRIVAAARAALREAEEQRCGFLVHASWAFLHAVEEGPQPGSHLVEVAAAAHEAEEIILESGRPACVVRLGYLYGPESRMLRAYRRAFRVARPYWAGPSGARHHHIHTADAADALLLAAETRPAGDAVYATDGNPLPFATLMDHFARLCGNPLPLHIPRIATVPARLSALIAVEHMEQARLGVPGPGRPQLDGFVPQFADYRDGLEQVLTAWRQPG